MNAAPCARLTAQFNRLSFKGRNALRVAAVSERLSALVRDGTQKRPWMYPFYMAFMVCLVSPLPFPGASTLMLLTMAGYAAVPGLPGSKTLRGHFNAAVKPDTMMQRYAAHIGPDTRGAESLAVRGWDLTRAVARQGLKDIRQATRHAINALR